MNRTDVEEIIERVRASHRMFQDPSAEIPVNLHGADLRGSDLSGLDLRGANLHGAQLDSAVLFGTNLDGANLHEASLDGIETDEKTSFRRANFHAAKFGNMKKIDAKTLFVDANLFASDASNSIKKAAAFRKSLIPVVKKKG